MVSVDQYIKHKIALRTLQQKIKDMEEDMLKQIKPGESFRTQLGTVSVGTRKTWKYSPKCKQVIDAIKEKEQSLGYAEEKETTFIRYNKPRGL